MKIEANSITLDKKNNTSIFEKEVKIVTEDGIIIKGDLVEYDKKKRFLVLKRNIFVKDKENNLKVNAYKGRWSVPFNKNPNRDTLVYYNYKNLFSHETGDGSTMQWKKYLIPASKDPYEFKFNKIENEFIKKQFNS